MAYRSSLLAFLLPLCVVPGFTFAQALTITTVTPAPNTRTAAQTSPVTVTFNQSLTAGAAALKVYSAQRGGLRTRGAHLATVSANTLRFEPTGAPYLPGETVAVSVTKAAVSASGAVTQPRVTQFTTAVGGTGRGAFTAGSEVTVGGQMQHALVGDVDGDGDLDLITTSFGYRADNVVRVHLNGGDASGSNTGVFSNATVLATGPDESTITMGDVDGDGDLDILVATAIFSLAGPGSAGVFTGLVTTYLNGGANSGATTGRFSKGSTVRITDCSFLRGLALADVDGDGDLDLLAVRSNSVAPPTLAVRLNGGDASGSNTGTFSNGSDNDLGFDGYAQGLAVGDLDGDGDLDVLTLIPVSNRVCVLLNGGNNAGSNTGVFRSGGVLDLGYANPQNIVVGDVDGDGDLDFLTANPVARTVGVYLNDGNASSTAAGTFSRSQEVAFDGGVYDVALADVDADGDLDLLAGCVFINAVVVRLNGGDASGSNTGAFSNGLTAAVGGPPNSLALGDLDGDGDLDLLATKEDGTISIRLNGVSPLLAVHPASSAGANGFVVTPTVVGETPLRYTYAGSLLKLNSLAIYTLTGQRVWEQATSISSTGILPTTGLRSGWYIVRLQSADQSHVARFYQP